MIKKLLLLFFLLILLNFSSAAPTNNQVLSKSLEQNSCQDSDKGIDFYIPGKIILNDNNGETIDSDFCASESFLYEKYCKFNSEENKWGVEKVSFKCSCTNGRCLKKSFIQTPRQIQQSPKKSFLALLIERLGFKSSATGSAIQLPQKSTIKSNWLVLVIFIILALIYLKNIYTNSRRKNQKPFKS